MPVISKTAEIVRKDGSIRKRYAFRHGKLVDITDERKTPTFYGRIKCDPPWTTGFKG